MNEYICSYSGLSCKITAKSRWEARCVMRNKIDDAFNVEVDLNSIVIEKIKETFLKGCAI